jgi:hypothetical protein
MKTTASAWLGALLGLLAFHQVPGAVTADDRFAVVRITNNTSSTMSFYRTWVWNYGTGQERVHLDWRLTRIPPGHTSTVYYTYQDQAKRSPDLIVVFDSDRNQGAHWEKVKLARGAAADYSDGRSGFAYALEYDNARREFASLRPKNGGTVTVLDRRASPPAHATEMASP